MEKLSELASFKEKQNIVLEGFDPVSSSGFTQVPNILLNDIKTVRIHIPHDLAPSLEARRTEQVPTLTSRPE